MPRRISFTFLIQSPAIEFELEEAFLPHKSYPTASVKGRPVPNRVRDHQFAASSPMGLAGCADHQYPSFRADGIGSRGSMGWLTPLPWYSELYLACRMPMENRWPVFLQMNSFSKNGPSVTPFVKRDVKGLNDLAYLARWVNSWDLNDELTMNSVFRGLWPECNRSGWSDVDLRGWFKN